MGRAGIRRYVLGLHVQRRPTGSAGAEWSRWRPVTLGFDVAVRCCCSLGWGGRAQVLLHAVSPEQWSASATWYDDGFGVEKKLLKAVELCTQAAEKECSSAMCSIGLDNEDGGCNLSADMVRSPAVGRGPRQRCHGPCRLRPQTLPVVYGSQARPQPTSRLSCPYSKQTKIVWRFFFKCLNPPLPGKPHAPLEIRPTAAALQAYHQ